MWRSSSALPGRLSQRPLSVGCHILFSGLATRTHIDKRYLTQTVKSAANDGPSIDLFTDASGKGYGAHTGLPNSPDKIWCEAYSPTRPKEADLDIVVLEIEAVVKAIKALDVPAKSRVKLRVDNPKAVQLIAAGPSSKSTKKKWDQAIEDLYKEVTSRKLKLEVQHVPGSENAAADRLSRGKKLYISKRGEL